MRLFLGVHRFAPTAGVVGDMGWLSLKYRRCIAMLRLWNPLIAMNESRITKRIFTWFYDHSDNNWCMDIKRISTELDMLHIYDSKLFFNIRQAQEKCWDLMYMEWQNNVENKKIKRFYRDIKL